ncbi:MAG: serine O-acetyltransferase [Pseudomonadota bacterium]
MLQKIWLQITQEVRQHCIDEPMLASFLHATVLKHSNLCDALSYVLASLLDCPVLPSIAVREIINEAYVADHKIVRSAALDIVAFYERDPVCDQYSTPFLFLKGFHAMQTYRVAHWLWKQNRRPLARFLQSRSSSVFTVDIHPGAVIGSGILLDHAHGLVIGETAVVEDDVSILHGVTLGGTGKETGDRHPKIRRGVLLSTGATVLGNVEVGEDARVAAGSVVLEPVPAHVTVAGIPAHIVSSKPVSNGSTHDCPAMNMDQTLHHKKT